MSFASRTSLVARMARLIQRCGSAHSIHPQRDGCFVSFSFLPRFSISWLHLVSTCLSVVFVVCLLSVCFFPRVARSVLFVLCFLLARFGTKHFCTHAFLHVHFVFFLLCLCFSSFLFGFHPLLRVRVFLLSLGFCYKIPAKSHVLALHDTTFRFQVSSN